MAVGRFGLIWRDTILADRTHCVAQADLLCSVFGPQSVPRHRHNVPPQWRAGAYFDGETCIATIETCNLRLNTTDGLVAAGGVRLVGVAPAWRGQGLFRDLMDHGLRRFAAEDVSLVLLFTEEPDLYRRFGFDPIAQHAFAGAPPQAQVETPARPIDAARDRGLIERLLATRAPVSGQVALVDAPSLFLDRIDADETINLAYLPARDALVAFEAADDALTIIDVVAAEMPPLAGLLGAMPQRFSRVTTLFPPDRLAWMNATPVHDDTGLMARGTLPPAMQRPFMLPPTTEF